MHDVHVHVLFRTVYLCTCSLKHKGKHKSKGTSCQRFFLLKYAQDCVCVAAYTSFSRSLTSLLVIIRSSHIMRSPLQSATVHIYRYTHNIISHSCYWLQSKTLARKCMMVAARGLHSHKQYYTTKTDMYNYTVESLTRTLSGDQKKTVHLTESSTY